jgi:hypothetical protein
MSSKPSRGVGSDGAQAVDQQRQHVDGSPALAVSTEEKNRWAVLHEKMRLFAWLISHQPTVLFSQNKPATSQQYFSLRTNQHQPSATGQMNRMHQENEAHMLFVELLAKHSFFTTPTQLRASSIWNFGVEKLRLELEPSQTDPLYCWRLSTNVVTYFIGQFII